MAGPEHDVDTGTSIAVADDDPAAEPSPADQPPDAAERLTVATAPGLASTEPRLILAGALTLALVASLVACAVLAWRGGDSEPTSLGRQSAARDEARAAALHDVQTLMTADHRDAAGTFDNWSAVTTGRLHAQLDGRRKAIVKQLRATREVTDVRTFESALSSWDAAGGSARLLAVLELRTTSGGKPTTRVVRYLAMTQRVDGEWLLSAVQQLGGTA